MNNQAFNITKKIESENYIFSSSKISSNSKIIFDAMNKIELLPGFEVSKGALFYTQNDGCGNN